MSVRQHVGAGYCRMAMRTVCAAFFVFGILLLIAPPASAQIPTLRLQGPKTLVGIVVDTAGVPIAGVEVILPEINWRTRSRTNGTFRFDSVPRNFIEVRARGVGLLGPDVRAVIGVSGGSVVIRMARLTQLMPDVVTRAARGGLTGIVVDERFRPLRNVKVRALGGMSNTTTDSLGIFFMPLKIGRYMLRMDRDGFERQTLGVTVEDSTRQRVTAILREQEGRPNIIEGASLTELESRMIRSSPASTKYFSRDDLETLGILDLTAFARRWATGQVTNFCKVILGASIGMEVPGGKRKPVVVPIDQLTTADLEFVELYLPTMIGKVRSSPNIRSGPKRVGKLEDAAQGEGASDCGNIRMIVWLRK